jgi:mannose/fructose/N-acetylgalactosamine-specific phosphotransferase system component IIC
MMTLRPGGCALKGALEPFRRNRVGMVVDILQWVVLVAVAAFVAQDTTAGPQLLVSEPLVAGLVTGWFYGDAQLGLLIGIGAQLIWCGAVPAGATVFLDVNVATVCAVAAVLFAGVEHAGLLMAALAMVWIIPVGLLGSGLTLLQRRLAGSLVGSFDPKIATARTIAARHLAGWALAGIRGALTALVAVPIGAALLPIAAASVEPFVRPELVWVGILGAGGGTAVGATWRRGGNRAVLFGVLVVAGVWVAMRYAV